MACLLLIHFCELNDTLSSRTAKERRLGSIGYAEAMLVAYNRKCKYLLRWTKLYEKSLGTSDGLDVDTDSPADEEEGFDGSVDLDGQNE